MLTDLKGGKTRNVVFYFNCFATVLQDKLYFFVACFSEAFDNTKANRK